MTKTFAKIGALTLGVAFALSLSVNTAKAVTAAELQAQINALMAQLASLQGTTAVGASFTTDLTVGSTGPQVVALQQMLVAQGHLVMPAGVAYGYFGSLTKAAVMRWQAANGVPATGYFGPISRAKANGMGGATGTVPGTTIGGGTTVGGSITTPGVEGILTATLAPVPGAGVSVEEGENKVAVLGVELEAELSDIKIERVKIKLDQTTTATNDKDFYRDIAERLYVMSGSTVLASVALNSDTVIEETSGNFYVTITGLNFIVPKDSEKTLTIAIDAQDSWDSDFDDDTWTVTIPDEGIRGVDGAGINQYTDGTFARTFSTDPSSTEDASLTVSLSSDTPDAAQVIANEGSDEDEADGVEIARYNVKAEDDDVTITDVVVTIARAGSGTATATTAYLFHGSTQIASASVAGNSTATFDDLEFTVDEDDTETLSIRIDVIDANTTATTFTVSNVAVTAENAEGDSATVTGGSADGNTFTVLSAGPEFSLVSKSITKTANDTNSTAQGTFNIKVTAVGGDVVASTTGAFDIDVFVNGTASGTAVEGVYNVPSGATVSGSNITIAEGSSATFVVDALYTVAAGNTAKLHAFGVEDISMNNATFSFMDGDVDWRTSTVVLP